VRSSTAGGHDPVLGIRQPIRKFVTFGVRRGCIAVAAPVSLITWLIPVIAQRHRDHVVKPYLRALRRLDCRVTPTSEC